jgi:hypothetical protein
MLRRRHLINTPLQRGESGCFARSDRFSGFSEAHEGARPVETAEAVGVSLLTITTPLKRGVNERFGNVPSANHPNLLSGASFVSRATHHFLRFTFYVLLITHHASRITHPQ